MKKLSLTTLVVISLAATFTGGAFASSQIKAGKDVVARFTFQGQERSYLLHLPPGLDQKKPIPLVLVLHYYTGTGRAEAEQTGFSKKADKEHFMVVYPDGSVPAPRGLSWNIWHNPKDMQGRGDIAFVKELIRRLSAQFAIDPKRIYVTGMSQGGMISHLAASELSSLIAAVASVGGFITQQPKAGAPVSVLIIHGMDDAVVPYRGGILGGGRQSRGGRRGGPMGRQVPAVAEATAIWVAHNGCSRKVKKTQQGKVIKELYTGGKAGTEVVVYTIVGGGHNWPGDRNDKTGSGFKATDVIWEFFKQHPKK